MADYSAIRNQRAHRFVAVGLFFRRALRLISFSMPGLLCALLVGSAVGQETELDDFRTGIFVDEAEQPAAVYKTGCPTFSSSSCDYRYPKLKSECKVVSVDSVGAVRDRQIMLGTYRRTTTFGGDQGGAGDEPWTCESDEVLLMETRPGDYTKAVWYGTAERTYEFITSATIAHSSKADIFSVTYCLNGTGGCEQRMFVWISGELQPLKRDSTWDSVYAQLPAGYRPHKSPPIDLENLKWEHHIAGPRDPNCCPSGRLMLDLDIVGDQLSVKRARLEVDLAVER